MASGRKTGGRKKGTPNKSIGKLKAVTREPVQVGDVSPLEVMLSVMRGEKTYNLAQVEAAKAAAPYVHAKKVEQQNTHVFAQFGERLDQMNRRDKDYTGK